MTQFQHQQRARHKGLTLIELSLSIMILAILSVAVSNLVLMGVQGQLNQRADETSQIVGMAILSDMRADLQQAWNVDVPGNVGNRVTMQTECGPVTYRLNGVFFEREGRMPVIDQVGNMSCAGANNTVKVYNNRSVYDSPRLVVRCAQIGNWNTTTLCFRAASRRTSDGTVREVAIDNELRVEVEHNNGIAYTNTALDRAMGPNWGPSYFGVRQITFDVMAASEFQ